jgi:hypothetical protein
LTIGPYSANVPMSYMCLGGGMKRVVEVISDEGSALVQLGEIQRMACPAGKVTPSAPAHGVTFRRPLVSLPILLLA